MNDQAIVRNDQFFYSVVFPGIQDLQSCTLPVAAQVYIV